MDRFLIVNADDFGLSPGINRGIAQAHERGIVTSASLMVRARAAAEAANYAHERPGFSLGLHVDLGEWQHHPEDGWRQVYRVAADDEPATVREAVMRQLEEFRRVAGRDPTHIDSHQHVHLHEPARSVLLGLAGELGVPLRHLDAGVQYCGSFYGQTGKGAPLHEAIQVDALVDILLGLPPGTTELACHPGLGRDFDSVYRDEREMEVAALCNPRIREALQSAGVRLISFTDPSLPKLTMPAN